MEEKMWGQVGRVCGDSKKNQRTSSKAALYPTDSHWKPPRKTPL